MPGTGSSASPPLTGRPVADRVLGAVGGAMILAAVILLFVGGESDGAAGVAADAPALELVQPKHGSAVRTERLFVVFRSEDELRPRPGGWGTDSLHLHLSLNGTELMPAQGDIERLPDGLFRWTLPRPEPGVHTLRLFWSGPDHRPIGGTGSRAVQVEVE
jgi:hypothetical protein